MTKTSKIRWYTITYVVNYVDHAENHTSNWFGRNMADCMDDFHSTYIVPGASTHITGISHMGTKDDYYSMHGLPGQINLFDDPIA